jgi:hypothetical protein
VSRTIARAVRTCTACPSQWDAWTADGQYLYLRYRSGIGTADAYDDPDSDTWTTPPDGNVARFDTEDRDGWDIDLEDFCDLAGLHLALDNQPGTEGRPTVIARIRRWISSLPRRISRRDATEYEVGNGVITFNRPMSEADIERFRAEFERRHRRRQH